MLSQHFLTQFLIGEISLVDATDIFFLSFEKTFFFSLLPPPSSSLQHPSTAPVTLLLPLALSISLERISFTPHSSALAEPCLGFRRVFSPTAFCFSIVDIPSSLNNHYRLLSRTPAPTLVYISRPLLSRHSNLRPPPSFSPRRLTRYSPSQV